ncbi:MAG TPA: LytTR family DNA-binding domain-containing protein [Bacteroidales bacterium]|jgi:DNA-binding LytR/AlgR family response regulator|nr:LytTR family DNA-binding domain-containing protein [Bacteroidales bacterium]HOS72692.1 LytTR family DNA-binding domain-containing protein [Bacteroidales bacterium]HQH24024.1 LytTR family DNA-binding domain-containing protein [Bacteroidales bacterium]HQJ82247.1 LytTR family DNA-binding domain-containing protein [Bacteroidales bacterium]
MKILIIEDESVAADKLEKMLLEIDPSITVAGKRGSIRDSVKWLMQNRADIIFLDIQLSDGISFSIFEQVEVNTPVIFTTAYDQYAVRAFQLNSIAYLLKPIRRSELAESLRKYQSLRAAFSIDFDALLTQLQGRDPGYRKRFLVQTGEKIRKIEVQDIAWFNALEKSVYMKTSQGQSFPSEFSLDGLERILDPACFFRINRKYLVNINAIAGMTAWSRGRIKLELRPKADNELDAVVSIDRSAAFRRWLNA